MTERPNILLLHTDQQRFDTIAALGAAHMLTPNLDRLVNRGTSFIRGYSANPVCMPARHDLITGASARHHGYFGNTSDSIKDYGLATVPRLLSESGYQTIAVGKMHFEPEREHHGFAHMFLMEELPTCRENDAYLQYLESVGYGDVRCQHGVRPLFYHTPQKSRVPEEHHGSAWVAHKTIECITEEREAPWFVFSSWVGPHPPLYMPEEYLNLYKDADLPGPCPQPEGGDRHAPAAPVPPDDKLLRRVRETYLGAITLIDKHIGRILDTLEETGQLDNTIIFFMSDHGEMLGDRGAFQKHVPYEGSAHIPLLASGPGFESGKKTQTPATTWDVSATILAAAGVEVPEDHPLVGSDMREVAKAENRVVCYHHALGNGRYVAAVDNRYKFVHWLSGGEEELYDLDNDPWEQQNLIEDAAHQDAASKLREAAVAFERDHGVAENVKDGVFVDLDFKPAWEEFCSFHPFWSYWQPPRWMVGYSKDDLDAMAQELRDCLNEELADISPDTEYRKTATEAWAGWGGDPKVLEVLFEEVDKRHNR